MRLFGNIYGGEVALGVITGLTVAFIPVGLLGLDFLLNAIQALIFSVLTLVFITLAIESHRPRGRPRRRGRRRTTARAPTAARPLRRTEASISTVPMNPGRWPGE